MPVPRAPGPPPVGTAARPIAERPVLLSLLAAATVVLGVAVAVEGAGGLLPGDERLARWIADRRGDGVESVFAAVTLLGDGWTAVVVLGAAAVATGRRHRAVAVSALVLLAARFPLVYGLKALVGSARPGVDPVAELATGAWPSGHAFTATLAWGFAPAAVGAVTGSTRARAVAVGAALLVIPAVAVSRVVLGVHWVVDVVGGVLVGLLALVVVDRALDRAGDDGTGDDPSSRIGP